VRVDARIHFRYLTHHPHHTTFNF
jgi:Aldehyde dehydrogenase family